MKSSTPASPSNRDRKGNEVKGNGDKKQTAQPSDKPQPIKDPAGKKAIIESAGKLRSNL